jgi:hypothetical protein
MTATEPENLKLITKLPVKDYTTTEEWTGGYWIDGKPIYRRVFTGNIVAAADAEHQEVLATEAENMISYGGWWQIGEGFSGKYSLCAYSPSSNANLYGFIFWNANQSLRLVSRSDKVRAGTNNNAYQIYVEYTKIAD